MTSQIPGNPLDPFIITARRMLEVNLALTPAERIHAINVYLCAEGLGLNDRAVVIFAASQPHEA